MRIFINMFLKNYFKKYMIINGCMKVKEKLHPIFTLLLTNKNKDKNKVNIKSK